MAGREFGYLGAAHSQGLFGWLAAHRGRLTTFLLGGRRLSLLLVWDRRGKEKVDLDAHELIAVHRLVHGKPYPNPPFTEPTDIPDEPESVPS